MLTNEMKLCFPHLKRTSYGKQVMAIEKLLYGMSGPPGAISNNSHNSSMSGPSVNSSTDEHPSTGARATSQALLQNDVPMNILRY